MTDFVFTHMGNVPTKRTKLLLSEFHRFLVYSRYHETMPKNRAVSILSDGCSWRGDILVIRLGTDGHPVGIHTALHQCMAEEAVLRWVL